MGTESKVGKTFDPFKIDKECFDHLDNIEITAEYYKDVIQDVLVY